MISCFKNLQIVLAQVSICLCDITIEKDTHTSKKVNPSL